MKKTKNPEKAMTRDMYIDAVRAEAGEEKGRKVELSFSSEVPYSRCWGVEILDHADGAVDLTRLNEIGCVLFNHKRDVVIGKITRLWIEKNRGCAEIEFDTDDEAEKIYQKVMSGTLKGVSVGYSVESWEEVAANKKSVDGRFTGPAMIARRWTPYEISIVSIPADDTVGVGRDLELPRGDPEEKEGNRLAVYVRQLEINKNLYF